MDLIKIATQLLMNSLSNGSNGGLSATLVQSALKNLLPVNSNGDLDLSKVVGMLQNGGLASLAASWLGNGSNSPISAGQVTNLLGASKVNEFAQALGLEQNTAIDGLSKMLPDLIDKNSRDGDLLGSDAVAAIAKGVLGKLFS
jgi:uncharacterized protein YidB (DUF937 family)